MVERALGAGWPRRDLWLHTDGTVWRVEARKGDGDAHKWVREYLDEAEARAQIAAMMNRTGGDAEWRDITC